MGVNLETELVRIFAEILTSNYLSILFDEHVGTGFANTCSVNETSVSYNPYITLCH